MPSTLRRIAGSLANAVLSEERKEKLKLTWLRKYMVASVISRESASERRARIKRKEKPVLFHLDISLTEHCNLKCKGCEYYSSVAEEKYADLDVVTTDLKRLAELFENIEEIFLMGGEPLLHPQVNSFILNTRAAFPDPKLCLMTNGILVTRMKDDFWETMRDTGSVLLCDDYPINIDREGIETLCAKWNVKLEWMPAIEEFYKIPVDVSAPANPKKSFNRCRGLSNCASLREGKLYGCGHIAFSDLLQKRFGDERNLEALTPTPADYVDIYKENDGDEIIKRLMSPTPWCSMCDFDSFETYTWGRSKEDPSEWLSEEN